MIELSNCRWKALPDMREGRYAFNPCLFSGFVYVCGCGSNSVEAFCPQTCSFLPLSLPGRFFAYCLYVHKNLLVVHSIAISPSSQQDSQANSSKHSLQISTSTPTPNLWWTPIKVSSTDQGISYQDGDGRTSAGIVFSLVIARRIYSACT